MNIGRALLIDPDSRFRQSVQQLLGSAAAAVAACSHKATVQESLRSLAISVCELVILGPGVPRKDAMHFLEAAEEHADDLMAPGPPLIAFLKSEDPAYREALRAAGADVCLKADAITEESLQLAVEHARYRRKVQAELRQQHREMERLDREAQGRAEELRIAKEAAERANAAKDAFLATLSHELRTPLTPVLSLVSSTLTEAPLGSDLRETFEVIQRNIELEARFIDDLLDLTQISSGRLALEKRPVDMHACIRHALEICQEGFRDRRITVSLDLKAGSPFVVGDYARLHQVLWNLLKNAIKFTPPGGHVEINTADDGGGLAVEIRDNGVGIESERILSIFSAFSSRTGLVSGTGPGLGLAIARAIVEAHGGIIRVQSEGRDCGSVFRFKIPVTKKPEVSVDRPMSEEVRDYSGHTVLVVEDHEDTRRVLSRALRRRGFGVTVAEGVESACEQFENTHPDLVICDLGLPDGTGWDALRRLREFGPVKAIAMSGFGMDDDIKKSRDAGFAAHLTKPVNFPHLENVLAAVLNEENVAC
jgi:signal transduction histidine kinase/ActR/RegA family two-component response regulator